jgi:hypothetical protein
MEKYSARDLTFFTDRLPSIQGIAKEMHASLQQLEVENGYAAGLWKGDLYRGMLWRALPRTAAASIMTPTPDAVAGGGGPGADRPYIAPSWSWAAHDGPVAFSSLPDIAEYMCKIEECHTEPVRGADAFGPILGGYVRIRGCPARFESFDDEVLRSISGEVWSSTAERGSRTRRQDNEGIHLDVMDEDQTAGVKALEGGGFWILPAVVEERYHGKLQHHGLVLRGVEAPVGDGGEGNRSFARVGVFVGIEVDREEGRRVFGLPMWEERVIILR